MSGVMPMAASSAEGLTMVRGPYFTKYREDYWNPVSSVSSVMFKVCHKVVHISCV